MKALARTAHVLNAVSGGPEKLQELVDGTVGRVSDQHNDLREDLFREELRKKSKLGALSVAFNNAGRATPQNVSNGQYANQSVAAADLGGCVEGNRSVTLGSVRTAFQYRNTRFAADTGFDDFRPLQEMVSREISSDEPARISIGLDRK